MTAGFRPEIERALRYIGEHLGEPLPLAEVARAARLSPFHFHRVFHAVLGEPVGRFIARRRLELAALRLAYEPDRSVTDIALSSGYSSPSNFSKAFSAHFGCSPSQLRDPDPSLPEPIGKLTAVYGKRFSPRSLYSLSVAEHLADLDASDLDEEARRAGAARWQAVVRFETRSAMDFACLASPAGYQLAALEELWREMVARMRQLGADGERGGEIDAWGRAQDSPELTAPELCRYHACVPYPREAPLPAPLFRGQMAEGRYAVFPFEGSAGEVEVAYRSIYASWFAEASVAPDDYEPLDHYIHDGPRDGRIAMELWFKLRPRSPSP